MARLPQIKINKLENDSYEIIKDNNFAHLMGMSSGFYTRVLQFGSKFENVTANSSIEFKIVLNKIKDHKELKPIFNKKELFMIDFWIKSLCEMLLEIDAIDLKEKNLVKYLKLSQSFTLKLKTILEEKS